MLYRHIALRRKLKQSAQSVPFSVPVIIVGNITVGGTGKTPFIIWLCHELAARGIRPAIVSRGYGGNSKQYPLIVTHQVPVKESGDEPALLADRSGCPVIVDPDRQAAVKKAIRECQPDLIISDDGLQHYRLHRDMEIIMLDGGRGLGNNLLLPAGPLRETADRLTDTEWVFAKLAEGQQLSATLNQVQIKSVLSQFNPEPVQVAGQKTAPLTPGTEVIAVAGIGNPEPFFLGLRRQGFIITENRFADHHQFRESDFEGIRNKVIIMTDKDWVKCRDFSHIFTEVWLLPLEYRVLPELKEELLNHIDQFIIRKQ